MSILLWGFQIPLLLHKSMNILKIIIILLEVLLIFNLLIIVHELGHFLAARWRGLVVEKFAVWFGKPIWSKTINGVEYRLGSIPAGGFVAIPQLAPMEAVEGKTTHDRAALPPITPLDKIIVAAAGPLFSLGLAFVFAVAVWMIGRPVGLAETDTVIGYVVEDSPAAEAGIRPGDRFLRVNNQPVKRFAGMGNVHESIIWNVASSEEPLIAIEFERDGEVRTVMVAPTTPEQEGWGRKQLRQIGIAPAQIPMIARVFTDSPAAEAGLQPRDVVLAVDGRRLLSMGDLAEYLADNGTRPINLEIRREGEIFETTVTPRIPADGTEPRIGILWDQRGETVLAHPNPFHQVIGSVRTMWATVTAIASPGSEIGLQHLSGPVGIMRLYYLIFEAPDGWRTALWFSVVLNVNLAILNLLPLPILDGGHITLALIEAIRRKPLNIRVVEVLQTAFAILIIGFMLYVTFFDVQDIQWWRSSPEEVPDMRFTPHEPTPTPPP